MLSEFQAPVYSEMDLAVFDAVVRRDHPLRLALQVIDFQALRQRVVSFYSDKPVGRRPIEPLLMIKLEMLMDRDRLSDRQVIERSATEAVFASERVAGERLRLVSLRELTKSGD